MSVFLTYLKQKLGTEHIQEFYFCKIISFVIFLV